MEPIYSSCIDESLSVYEDMPVFRAAPNVISCASFDIGNLSSYDEIDVSPIDLKANLSSSKNWFDNNPTLESNFSNSYCVTSSVPTYYPDDVFPLAPTHCRIASSSFSREYIIERIQLLMKRHESVIFCESVINFCWKCNASRNFQSETEQVKFSINLYLVGDSSNDSIVEVQRLKGSVRLMNELYSELVSEFGHVYEYCKNVLHPLTIDTSCATDTQSIESTIVHLCECAGKGLYFGVDSVFSVLNEILYQLHSDGGMISDSVKLLLFDTLTGSFPLLYQKVFQLSTGYLNDRSILSVDGSLFDSQLCLVQLLECMKWSLLTSLVGQVSDAPRPFIEFFSELQELNQFSRCFAIMHLATDLLRLLTTGLDSTPTSTTEYAGICSPLTQRSPSGVTELYPFLFSSNESSVKSIGSTKDDALDDLTNSCPHTVTIPKLTRG